MMNYFHVTFILCVAIVVFCLLQGYFGKTLQRVMKIIFNPSNIEYLVIFLFILGLLYFYMNGLEYCIDEDL